MGQGDNALALSLSAAVPYLLRDSPLSKTGFRGYVSTIHEPARVENGARYL